MKKTLEGMQKCPKCGKWKQLEGFYSSYRGKNGRQCKKCDAAKSLKYRQRNPVGHFSCRANTAIGYAVRGMERRKAYKYFAQLPYSLEELRAHLKITLPKGYTWEDYLAGRLQLDHIQPQVTFGCTSELDPTFKECWALSNLRLLPVDVHRLEPPLPEGMEGYLSTKQAARYVGLTVDTLCRKRHRRQPPEYIHFGPRVYYRKADLDAFLSSREKPTETRRGVTQDHTPSLAGG
jgi:hypothetical protein